MSANNSSNEDQEIDLGQISKKIGDFFDGVSLKIFNGIQYIKKNILTLGILFVIGAGIGFYLDYTNKSYDNQIIVTPNFNSTDYLYSKIDLINSKIKEQDTVFLKNIVGIKNTKKFNYIQIEPITDVYGFIKNNPENFDFIKLLAEDGDMKKIVEDKLTSRNYSLHNISFTTSKHTTDGETVIPILNYLNNSEYYKMQQKIYVENVKEKIKQNDSIISQINGVLNNFSKTTNNSQKSNNLVYYNENTQLNDVIKTKNELIIEQGYKKLELVTTDKVVKESSSTLNIKNSKGTNGKMKLIIPILFILIFVVFGLLRSFYRKQLQKVNTVS
jgi:hypothetical protein